MGRPSVCWRLWASLLLLLPGTVLCLPGLKHYETLSYDPVTLRQPRSLTGFKDTSVVHLHFNAFNRSFDLELAPSRRVFAPGVKFVMGNGTNIPYDPRTFHHGHVIGESHSSVSGHIINGVFDGVINTPTGEYHIEKAHKFFTNDQEFHSVIYRTGDVDYTPAPCGAKEELLRKMKKIQSTAIPLKEPKRIYGSQLLRRKRLTPNMGTFCQMLVAADHLFLQAIGGGDEASTIAEIVAVMSQVQTIYRNTDFDRDGTADNIVPIIAKAQILDQNEPGYRFNAPNIEVNNFLDLWSQEDHSQFCLALLLTYRDFAQGVLGLAWVAEPPGGNRGGICEGAVRLATGERYLNTAIVTFLNFGQRQPRSVSIVTIAHEIGHNFGSPHDPNTAECSPGGSAGNFIMFAQATDGSRTNNKRFSLCSRNSMGAVLRSTRSNCFSTDGSFCGNGALEEGEECDCGDQCDTDNCCRTNCTLKIGANCTGQQECCDGEMCSFLNTSNVCRAESDCAAAVVCNGSSAVCPNPIQRQGTILCNNGANVCQDGICSGSFCLSEGMVECDCENVDDQGCHVCCRPASDEGECTSTFTLFPGRGQFKEPGRTCNNFEGYCDNSNPPDCIVVDNEDTLRDLLDIFTIDTLNNIVAWLTVYWYIPVAVIIGIAILIICLHFTYRRRKPLKRRLSRARNSLRGRPPPRGVSDAQTGGVGGVESSDGGGRQRRRRGSPRQITQREALNRLKQFFPTADRDTIGGVMQVSQSESKAVKRLLELGFPLKKVPIPRA